MQSITSCKMSITIVGVILSALYGCTLSKRDISSADFRLASLTTENLENLSHVKTYSDLTTYLQSHAYYDGGDCENYVRGGEKIYYSTSYNVDTEASQSAEAAQADGYVEKVGTHFYFHQRKNTTNNVLFAPGLGDYAGRSLWDIKRYLKTLCSVALGKGRSGADYDNFTVSRVHIKAGTSSGVLDFSDAIKINYEKSESGSQSKLTVVFVKNHGPRIMEYRNDGSPSGTVKFYMSTAEGASETSRE